MSPDLPEYIEPARLADNAERLEGTLDIAGMDRLAALLEDRDTVIAFRLSFGRNEAGAIVISGDFSTDITLRCQRCLEALRLHLEKTIRVGGVRNKSEAETLPADLEPMQFEGNRIPLRELIEEEVLLGLPISPVHKPEECSATEMLEELKETKESPFAVLRDLKDR